MKNLKTEVVVIGGGAAGMMCSATAAENGRRVILLEPNEKLGKKVYLTGKGRCNVTNNCEPDEMLKCVPVNPRFLYSSIYEFGPKQVMEYFEGIGVPLKTERGNRVFPVSDKSSDIIGGMTRHIRALGVEILRESVLHIVSDGGKVTAVETAESRISCESAVICTGGMSYPATGSTGDGYRLAEEHGHTVTKPRASLVPLTSPDECCPRLQGLSLRNVSMKVKNQKNKVFYEGFGEMLFTHFGITGPLVLSASAHLRDYAANSYRAIIDMKPALDEEKLDARMLRDFDAMQNRDIANCLGALLHKSMIPVMLDRCGIAPETKVHSITREQRRVLRENIKGFVVNIDGTRPINEAIATSGGVKVKELDPSTMQSKLLKGLYFAGEVIDVDAYTGGYNLTIAWSTGHNAGVHA